MAQDKANIFKLSNEEQEIYTNTPFFDAMPGTEKYADTLLMDIITKETPHTLLLEADYGMGKTFFCTRFAKYLRSSYIKTIYFSAWENDYISDPLIAILKEMTIYFEKEKFSKRIKGKINSFTKKTIEIAQSTSFNFGITAQTPDGTTKANAGVNINTEKFLKAFIKESHLIEQSRTHLKEFINCLEKQKLVFIVDELDRCRPDYAMKVLEAIKHFFDIEGLFFILPTNKLALNNAIKALYGIENNGANGQECYFKKFFNDERVIPKPDYKPLVLKYVNEVTLQKALENNCISIENDDVYYNLNKLQNALITYGKEAKLTLRQMKDLLEEIARMTNFFKEKIQCEYLAFLMCKQASNDKKIALNREHPLSHEHVTKNAVLAFHQLGDESRTIYEKARNYRPHHYNSNVQGQAFDSLFHNLQYSNSDYHKNFANYNDAKMFLDSKLGLIAKLNDEKNGRINDQLRNLLPKMKDILSNKYLEIETYQEKTGSSDNDEIVKKRYIEIVEKRETLYNKI